MSLKLLVVWKCKQQVSAASTSIKCLAVGLLGLNLTEIVAYLYASHPEDGYVCLVTYYIFLFVTFNSLLICFVENIRGLAKPATYSCIALSSLATLAMCIPGLAISGVEAKLIDGVAYSITKIAGPYYAIVQLAMLLPLFLIIFVAVPWGLLRIKNELDRTRLLVLILAFLPYMLTAILLIVLMANGINVNGSIYMSMVAIYSLWVTLYSVNEKQRRWLVSLIPGSSANKHIRQVRKLLAQESYTAEEALNALERSLIIEALSENETKGLAAQKLCYTPQTLARRIKKQHINTENPGAEPESAEPESLAEITHSDLDDAALTLTPQPKFRSTD